MQKCTTKISTDIFIRKMGWEFRVFEYGRYVIRVSLKHSIDPLPIDSF